MIFTGSKVKESGLAPILIIILFGIFMGASIMIYNNTKKEGPGNFIMQSTGSPTATPEATATPRVIGRTPTPAASPTPTATPGANSNVSQTPAATATAAATATPVSTPQQSPTVRVTYPNGGETFTEGDTMTITWDATGTFSSFSLLYSDCPSCAGNIASVNGSSRSYTWNKLSVGNTTNTQFKIWIISYPSPYSGPNPTDYSDANFTVYQNPACNSGCP